MIEEAYPRRAGRNIVLLPQQRRHVRYAVRMSSTTQLRQERRIEAIGDESGPPPIPGRSAASQRIDALGPILLQKSKIAR